MFLSHSDVDLRYALFQELGRTKLGTLDNTEFDTQGNVARMGTNQIGRYAVHFHHDFGPKKTPANGYLFTLVGNAVDGSSKWGVTVHHSSWGLIQDNVVYNTRGAGIVTEDGSERANIFDHNFSVRVAGSKDAAGGNGYSGTLPNPGGDGSAFWFRGPNNIIRNNVAAEAAESGFALPAMSLGTQRIAAFKGADTTQPNEWVSFDTTHATVPEFSNNEAYGTIQNGVTWVWNGTITKFTVWHASRSGVAATPIDKLVVDQLTVRGDQALLASSEENAAGVWIANYTARNVVIANANVQGVRIGVTSPFFYGKGEDSATSGSLTVENSYFRDYIGVNIATSYTDDGQNGVPLKKAEVRNSVFETLNVPPLSQSPPEAISMNYGMTPNDIRPRDPIAIVGFNKQSTSNFKVYYSLQAPAAAAPCHDTMPGIDGWVCK
jgi:hypothetical protein